MATKDDRPGLLSKVALFVRNPTKDWSELDRPEPTPESGYDKQALKAMIERKRQNDFVRKREFDQLRKLRVKEAAGIGNAVRPSIFQSSIATDPDGRAVTLKKIDEIEAQMSKQWWRNKQEGSAAAASDFPGAGASVSLVSSGNFASTQMIEEENNPTEFIETQMGAGMVPLPAQARPFGAAGGSAPVPPVGALADRYDGSDVGFSTSKLFALDVDEMATDPELEEAAIRFANGDDAGAERGLLQALRGEALMPEVSLSWAAALLDLYRATGNRIGFDQAVLEFATCFDRIVPTWKPIQTDAAVIVPASVALEPHVSQATPAGPVGSVGSAAQGAIWVCPAELSGSAMEALREAMSTRPMPWHLDWEGVRGIVPDAIPLLAGLFNSLCNEPVSLRFSGASQLVQAFRSMMPAGDRNVSPAWWAVRLDALRTMQMIDEFELAALDYCVTYEVAPPAWEPALCHYEAVAPGAATGLAPPAPWDADPSHAVTAPMGLEVSEPCALELCGEVLGDASQALAAMVEPAGKGARIVVSCSGLVRVDFAAAGGILNWAAQRQAQGNPVQFRDVHRLVAAFFNVIGINEHARVIPRPI